MHDVCNFAEKLHIDQIKANELQQIIEQKEREKEALESQQYADKLALKQAMEAEILAAKEALKALKAQEEQKVISEKQALKQNEITRRIAEKVAAQDAVEAENISPVSIEDIFNADKEALKAQMEADAIAQEEAEKLAAYEAKKAQILAAKEALKAQMEADAQAAMEAEASAAYEAKVNQINQMKENFDFDGPRLQVNPYSVIEVAPENGSRDGSVSVDVCSTDSWSGEIYYILLDTSNWWAWGASGWTQHTAGPYGCENFSVSVPAGNYQFILGDTYGDGGATAAVNVNGELLGSVSTAAGDGLSPYSNLYEAAFSFDVTDAAVTDATVTFDLDGLDSCGFVSVTGTFDGWSGWGATTDTGMSAVIPAGDHEFVILCVEQSTMDAGVAWWENIWGNSTQYSAPIDGSCWNGNYDYANYTLAVGADDMTVAYCAGTCDAACAVACEGTEYTAVVGGGTWDSEISWSLGDYSGGAGTFELCLADGDYTLVMGDAYGDGWNGGSFVMGDLTFAGPTPGYYEESVSFCLGAECAVATCDDDAACNTGAEGDCEYAAEGFDCDGNALCSDTVYDVTVGGGTWDSEISWALVDASGSAAASGGAGAFVLCLADGDYTLVMGDAYGDGWNGGSFVMGDLTFAGPTLDIMKNQ